MIFVESVQLENIEFSANYLHSIEPRMLAEVEVQWNGMLPTTMVPGSAVPFVSVK